MADLSQRALGLGTENAFVVLAEVNKLIREGRNIISFCIGQPDFATPQHIQDAGIAAIQQGKHGYTPSAGIPELRQAAADYFLAPVAFRWMQTTWWWVRVPSPSSATRFNRSPTTVQVTKSSTPCQVFHLRLANQSQWRGGCAYLPA